MGVFDIVVKFHGEGSATNGASRLVLAMWDLNKLQDIARSLAPAEGFGQSYFCPSGKQKYVYFR